ncbi:MAG: hypothetical protein PHY34_04415 [Patescibacteria group bacterium]|nr:hypothetical protein [Patescibacteria group bacterium]MDD5715700.1 hypothetical protein [Patescibacteria group bacterium]
MKRIQTISGTIGLLGITLAAVMLITAVSFTVFEEVDFLAQSADIVVGRLSGTVAGTEIQVVRVVIDRGLGTTLAAEVPLNGTIGVSEVLREAASAFGLPIALPVGASGMSVASVGDFANQDGEKAWNLYVNGERKTSWSTSDAIVFGDSVLLRYEAVAVE